MQLNIYNELVQRESQLEQDMKNFIFNAIKVNNGRITYTPKVTDDSEFIDLYEQYPIISTFEGRHDYLYNIAITDIYIQGADSLLADGIDYECNTTRKGFQVFPHHFSDIIYFIIAPLKSQINEYAERLTLKDFVDKYNKLPDEFCTEPGSIKDEFYDENISNIQKYTIQLENLYISCCSSECDKNEINSNLMAITCDLADLTLIEQEQKLMDDLTVYDSEEKSYSFTEDAQDKFNNIYDEIERQLWELMNFEGTNEKQ